MYKLNAQSAGASFSTVSIRVSMADRNQTCHEWCDLCILLCYLPTFV